jgi:hypothetical protein
MFASAVSVLPEDVAMVADVVLIAASAASKLDEELEMASEFT